MPLRPYQVKAIKAIRDNYNTGTNRQVLCMATGTGKTRTFSALPTELKDILPGKMMVIVHRDELSKQAYDKIVEDNPKALVQVEAGADWADPDKADIVIASVQTLGREGSKRIERYDFSKYDKYVVDEAHRSVTDSYLNIYNRAGLLQDGDKRLLLGLTATPRRADGLGLSTVYQKISYTYSLREAIEDGFLVDIKGIRVDTDTSLDGVSISGGDYDLQELATVVDNPVRNLLVARAYLANCGKRQAIGFAVNIAHAKNLAETFQKEGINAQAVWGEDPDRDHKILMFREGKIQVLFNAQLLVEGFDVASIECVILAAPTKSEVVFSQRVGRGTRLNPPLKKDCIVLDVCDSTVRHSLVTLPTLLGLPSGLNMKGRGLVECAKLVEEEQKQIPHLDFTTLKDIDKIKAFVQSVNLFEAKLPEEVEKFSMFTWYPHYSGGYSLSMPDGNSLYIKPNMLDKYEIYGTLNNKKYRGERGTLTEAFSAADSLVSNVCQGELATIKQDSHWHKLPATPKQIKRLKQFFKGKQIPPNISRGTASKLLGSKYAGMKLWQKKMYKKKG